MRIRWLLLALFLVVPFAELAVIVAVARPDRLGVLPTIGLLIAVSIAGSVLAKREGMEVWSRFRATLARGEVPSGEVLDGVLVLLGAALLLTPGFITDVAGLLLLFPWSRRGLKRIVRAGARRYVKQRLHLGGPPWDAREVRRIRAVRIDENRGSSRRSGRAE
ncbi:MAG: FxsA family protein [Actinomycetota bacterium]